MGERTRLTGISRWIVVTAMWAFLCVPAPAGFIKKPAPGVLLVASENMLDAHFSHTVVLLIENDQTGTWGLIINRPTDIAVHDVLTTLESGDKSNVYFGGPVHIERLVFLYESDVDPESEDSAIAGLPGLRWSVSQKALKKHLERSPDRLRVYAGYTGWAPGQLAIELARGDWKMIQGKQDNVFNKEPQRLWENLNHVLGGIAI